MHRMALIWKVHVLVHSGADGLILFIFGFSIYNGAKVIVWHYRYLAGFLLRYVSPETPKICLRTPAHSARVCRAAIQALTAC